MTTRPAQKAEPERASRPGPVSAYHRDIDVAAIATSYPPPPEHVGILGRVSQDEAHDRTLRRLRRVLIRAAGLPFYARRWAEAGFTPADLHDLADLDRVPTFTVNDLRVSIEQDPPFGSHQSRVGGPHRVLFSGGTTGLPRPVLHSARDREIGEIIQARHLWAAGLRADDIVMNSFGYGPHNAASTMHEAIYRWIGALIVPVSTGNVTSSRLQVTMAHQFRATAWIGMSDYLVHLADVARSIGLDPASDFALTTLVVGGDTELASRAWGGVPAYGLYGTYELQTPGGECWARGGVHYSDDAHLVQVQDEQSGRTLGDGELGQLVFTSLYNEAFPIVRFNTLDRSSLLPSEPCPCGQPSRKIAGFLGRSDTMVKLRGINIYPEDVGRIATEHPRANGEYFCVASRNHGADQLQVLVELSDERGGTEADDSSEAAGLITRWLRERLGVRIEVEPVPVGALAERTGLGVRTKPVRFQDERH
ncbi:MAG TPA: hypothetical protein VF163_05135 [Micromonosporaceae bacterium]